jgi:hypothetical protein
LEDIDAKNQMLLKLSSCTKGSTTCKLLFDWWYVICWQ